jgi:hypothetical protein
MVPITLEYETHKNTKSTDSSRRLANDRIRLVRVRYVVTLWTAHQLVVA